MSYHNSGCAPMARALGPEAVADSTVLVANLRRGDAVWHFSQGSVGDSHCVFWRRICAGRREMGNP